MQILEKVVRMKESGLLGDALTNQREVKENNWICGIIRELRK
jgi:hypothetical protein